MCSVMTTAACEKLCMEETEYETELLESVPQVKNMFMNVLCSVDMDLNLKEEDMLVDQTASPDTITVMCPCISHGEAHFSGQCIINSLLHLKFFS